MTTTQSQTKVIGLQEQKVYYRERGWGLFKYNEIIKIETIGRDIHIFTEHKIDSVTLNGKKLLTS